MFRWPSTREFFVAVAMIAGAYLLHWFVGRLLHVPSIRAWRLIAGAWFSIYGLVVALRKKVDIGIRGQEQSWMASGWVAVVLGILVSTLGICMIAAPGGFGF